MSRILHALNGAITIAALAILMPSAVSANRIDLNSGQPVMIICEDEIKLTSNDGSLNIRGELIAYENAIYRLKTPLGDVLFDAAVVQCEGVACPSSADIAESILAAENASSGIE